MRRSGWQRAAGRVVGGLAVVLVWSASGVAAECKAPRQETTTVIGIKYCADPAFDRVIQSQVQKIRDDVRAQRRAGKLTVYESTPISQRGGGYEKLNVEIAAAVKTKLEREYGGAVWVMNPAVYDLPPVDGKSAGGGEYMVMWTAVLAGEDGTGKDFDMAHFTGPGDMRAFFGCGRDDLSGCLERYVATRAAADEPFRKEIAENRERRAAFIRYYALRASSVYSTGSHDEWNIVVKINRKRPIGDQMAVSFDGRPASPAEMEVEVSPGYEAR